MTTASPLQQAMPLRLHFYAVAVRPTNTENATDLSLLAKSAMESIRRRAEDAGCADAVRLKSDKFGLCSRGIFFMQAPAPFAEAVKTLDGIQSVEMTVCKRKNHPRRLSRPLSFPG